MFVIILLLHSPRFYPVLGDKTVNAHIYTQLFATDDDGHKKKINLMFMEQNTQLQKHNLLWDGAENASKVSSVI